MTSDERQNLTLVDIPVSAVAVLTLNRPAALNALTTELVLAISDALEQLARRGDIRVVVVTGSGDRAFCAGADLKQRQGMSDDEWADQHAQFETTFERLRAFEKPVIAAVNGVAAGGGLELAMSCDVIVASETARFGQPEVSRGIMPGLGGSQLLPRLVAHGLATELLLTGRLIDADEARRAGLVTHVYAADGLLASTISLAESIAVNSPMAVRQIRRALRAGWGKPLDEALQVELDCYRETVTHPDRREGVSAFNEGRAPRFADPE